MRTAIILTGGVGTRMSPVTKTLNKAVVPVDGQPVLTSIVSQLGRAGVDLVIVLTGYLSWQVEFLLAGRREEMGAELKIQASPANYSPADRLLNSSKLWSKASEIILIYCDNFLNEIDVRAHIENVQSNSVFVQSRSPGNVKVDEIGRVTYHPNRKKELGWVELGYWRLDATLLYRYLIEEEDLQWALKRYTQEQRVDAFVIQEYRSLSTIEKFAGDRKRSRKTILLDRDGVLVASVGKGKYLKKSKEVVFLHENINLLKNLSQDYNVDYIVVTNQAGIERGLVTVEEVTEVNQFIATRLLNDGVPLLAFYVCPHHWESRCSCRKPKSGLLEDAMGDFYLSPSECLLIGDRESDIQAGQSLGIESFLVSENTPPAEKMAVFKQCATFLLGAHGKHQKS